MKSKLFTLVTGASSGLGREIALYLSASRKLVLHGRDAKRLEETRNACAHPDQHMLWQMDLGELDEIEQSLSNLLLKQNLAIECFVHCAGILKIQPMRMMKLSLAHEIMNVNFLSASEIIRLLLKNNVNQHQLGNIVFVSSTASKFGAKGFNLYCASKGALDSFMRALAVELAPKVRVNSVLPGGIRTSMTNSMLEDSELEARLHADYPLGLGKSSDIATIVEFLVSEKSRWITGQQLIVDGGHTVNITA
jgi:NAD(P)-dependent dehydrogenase (short-subunit alcohol dehydrogenase family)